MNEGFLGRHTLAGERAATGEHPVILHHLPLSDKARAAAISVGTVLKRVDVMGDEDESDTVVGAAWEPLLSTDEAAVMPVAVVDTPCDPTGENGEMSALCVVHGCVKSRLLKTGDNKALTEVRLAQLAECGVYAN